MKTDLEAVNSPACFPPPKELPFCLQILWGENKKKHSSFLSKKYLRYPKVIHKTVHLQPKLSPGLLTSCSLRNHRTTPGSYLISSTDFLRNPEQLTSMEVMRLRNGIQAFSHLPGKHKKQESKGQKRQQSGPSNPGLNQANLNHPSWSANFNAKRPSSAHTAASTTPAARQQKVSHIS